MPNARQDSITAILKDSFKINHLEVINESKFHHVPKDAETHFKVIIVSEHFNEMRLIQRHKAINQLLADEFANGLHALSIHAYTIKEWEKRKSESRPSPHCKDGFDK